MRKLLVVGLCCSLGACAESITRPSSTQFICKTQPRAYVSPAGVVTYEVDTYTQNTPCPAVPIQ